MFTSRLQLGVFLSALVLGSAGCSTFVAKAQQTPAVGVAASTPPDIGVGLEGLADWSRAMMFSDAMKTSRNWGRVDRPWEHEVKTDALGWPTEDAGVVVIADTPGIGGTYKLSFEGTAEVVAVTQGATIENVRFDAAKKIGSADVVVASDTTSLMLGFKNTQGGVKNVRLLRPGAEEGNTFSRPFLEKLAPFSTLRFMDFLSTNNNPVKLWSERTTPAHATQARPEGGALEYVVELANESDKDVWVNVPDQADENYARQMALLLKNGLEKERKVYVEFSNEVWNWGFPQATRNLDAAKIEGKQPNSPLVYDKSDNEGYWAMRRIAKRSVEVGRVFQEVFEDTTFERVRPVYAVQVGYEEVYKQGLEFLENQYGQPSKVLYGVAGAPYFNLNDEENKRGDITKEEILAVLPERVDESLAMATKLGAYADYYGLRHLAYEGGQHLQDHGGNGSADAKIAANHDPRMGEMVEKYLRGWNAIGGDAFMYFTLTSGYSKWGSWGLLEDPRQSSPKYEAALRVLRSPRAPLTFGAGAGEELKAGDFWGSNRWDARGADQITIEPEKWMQYAFRVPKAGTYRLTANLSGDQEAVAEVLANGKALGRLEVKAKESASLPLQAGLNVLRVRGVSGRFQLRSLMVRAE